MGEMKKDLKMMAEAGFNHVRFAALGDVSYDAENEYVNIDSPFVDAMIEEAEENGLYNLAGHSSVGGMRASIYNAMPYDGVVKLVAFMKKFALENPNF